MSTITEKIPSGESRNFYVSGHFLRIQSGDELSITFYREGRIINKCERTMSGFAAKVDGGFDRFDILNAGTLTADTRIFLGEENGIDIQFSGLTGTVSVINGALSSVRRGTCFVASHYATSAAAKYLHMQLWNPVASSKNIVLSLITHSVGAVPSSIVIAKSQAALTTLAKNGTNKNFSGADSAGEIRTDLLDALVSTRFTNTSFSAANDTRKTEFSEPILVPPGYGVVCGVSIVNVDSSSTFHWIEEDI